MSVSVQDACKDCSLTRQAFDRAMADFGGFEDRPLLLVAVSGGADSLALCLLAQHWAAQRDGSVHAVIVDHGLRSESAAEAAQVSAWLARHHIANTVLTWDGPKPSSGVQAAARQARYALMDQLAQDLGILHLLLGHHADDQRETATMRLERMQDAVGGGVAGMPVVSYRQQVRVLRPLLALPKSALENLCRSLGQDWVTDPSNASDKYERNRVRKALAQSSRVELQTLDRRIAEAQRRRTQTEAQLTAAMVRYVRLSPLGLAWIDQALFAEPVPQSVRQACLSRVVHCIGGRAYPPARDAVCAVLRAFTVRQTLGGCLLTPYKAGLLVSVEDMRVGQGREPIVRFKGGDIAFPPTAQAVAELQTWLKSRSRGENLPNAGTIRRFPVKMSRDDGCFVPCVGYSQRYSPRVKGMPVQNGANFRFSPSQSLTYCLEWLAPSDINIMS